MPSDCILIQQASGSHTHLLNLTIKDHSAYCLKWGMDYNPVFGSALTGKDANRHAFWNKVALLRKAVEAGYKYIIWLDADCWIQDDERDLRDACPEDGFGMVWHGKDVWFEGPECFDHFNCILPGQKVFGDFIGASKAWYSGQALEILTVSGMRLSVTTGHPIMTEKGLVPASRLRKGQNLLQYRGKCNRSRVLVGENVQETPPAVEEVFSSLKKLACSVSASSELVAPVLNFHGDAQFFKGDVDIVGTYGELWRSHVSHRNQGLQQGELIGPRTNERPLMTGRTLQKFFGGSLLSGKGSARTFGLGNASFGRHVDPCETIGFGEASQRNIACLELSGNRQLAGTTFTRDLFDRNAGKVSVTDYLKLCSQSYHSVGSGSGSNSRFGEFFTERTPVKPELVSDFLSRNPGEIHFDEIVEIKSFHYDGPVYDFQTVDGLIIADNLLISNCGAIWIGNGTEAQRFLNLWWKSSDDGHPWGDQAAMNLHAIPDYEKLWKRPAPLKRLDYQWNSVPFEEFKAKHPIVAAWHGYMRSVESRLAVMQQYIQTAKMDRMIEGCDVAEAYQKAQYCLSVGNFEGAEKFFVRADELGGGAAAEFYYSYAFAFTNQKKHAEAIPIILKGIEIEPENGLSWQLLGTCYDYIGEHVKNGEAIAKAREYLPNFPPLMHNLSLWQLRDGQWREGFENMQWSFLCNERIPRYIGLEWNGGHFKNDHVTVLLWAEGGLGDTLMLSRWVAGKPGVYPFAEGVKRVVMEVQQPLVDLFKAQCWPNVEVVGRPHDKSVPWDFNAHMGMWTLPDFAGVEKPDDVRWTPYLIAPADRIEKWAQRIHGDGLKVGFSWAGSQVHGNSLNRNASAGLFDDLVKTPNTRWYSLQRDLEIPQEIIDDTPEVTFIGDEAQDMADVAGMIASLDLIITVDSAIAHLAGAMGKPVFVLISKSADWRWLAQGDTTVWYQSMRLFRQSELGAWSEVIERVTAAFAEVLK